MTVDKRPPGIGTAFRNFDYEAELDRLKRSDFGSGGGSGGGGSVDIEAWRTVGAAGEPTFGNNWEGYPAYPPQFRKRPDGTVELRGLLKTGNTGQNAFTLPTAYKPMPSVSGLHFAVTQYNGSAYVIGDVFVEGGGGIRPLLAQTVETGFVALDGIRFSSDQATFPTGPEGPQGPPGPGGTDANLVHTQSTLASTWVITHALNKFPSVMVVDSGGNWVMPDIRYDSISQITVVFGAAASGKVYLN